MLLIFTFMQLFHLISIFEKKNVCLDLQDKVAFGPAQS